MKSKAPIDPQITYFDTFMLPFRVVNGALHRFIHSIRASTQTLYRDFVANRVYVEVKTLLKEEVEKQTLTDVQDLVEASKEAIVEQSKQIITDSIEQFKEKVTHCVEKQTKESPSMNPFLAGFFQGISEGLKEAGESSEVKVGKEKENKEKNHEIVPEEDPSISNTTLEPAESSEKKSNKKKLKF